MLTVIRELAEEAECARDEELPELLTRSSRAATRPSRGRQEQLDVLRKAGVVDAGGAGLVEILRGIAATSPASRCPRRSRRCR